MNTTDTADIIINNWEDLKRYMPKSYTLLLPCKGKPEAAAVLWAYEMGYDAGQSDPVRWIDRHTFEYSGRIYRFRELLELADRLHNNGQPIGKDCKTI